MEKLMTEAEKSRQKIREMIFYGKYRLNESLPQRKIAEELKVSPIVVRESFRMLENEGLVEIIPKWGARVTTFRVEKIRGIALVREALEGMAARILSKKITENEVLLLHKLAKEVDALFIERTADPKEVGRTHYLFHIKIAQLTGCLEIYETLERINIQYLLWKNSEAVVSPVFFLPPRWRHQTLVEVIAAGNPTKAERFMRLHVRKGIHDILNFLKKKTCPYSNEQMKV
ncbi:MAG: GntR family transcriptional regulator [Desulfocucumaceae bacterium]